MHRDLVERAMAGDHDAFSELARVSIGRLYAAARLILRDPQRVHDVAADPGCSDQGVALPSATVMDVYK